MLKWVLILTLTVVLSVAAIFVMIPAAEKQESHADPIPWHGNRDGKEMTLDDVRALAAKGDDLLFEDLWPYMGGNASSDLQYYVMVYLVEGGYRLIVHSSGQGKPDYLAFERIWDEGGSGIDIRYSDVDEFIRTHPSSPASEGPPPNMQ